MKASAAFERATERVTLFCFRHARAVLLAAACLLVLALGVSSRLKIQGDFVELLPSESPAAKRFREALARKGGGESTLVVLVQSSDRALNQRYIDRLESRLSKLPSELVSRVESGPREIRAYIEKYRWLFLSREDLTRAECELDLARQRAAPGYVDLGETCDDGAPGEASAETVSPDQSRLQALRERVQARIRAEDRFPDGYYNTADGSVYALVVKARRAGMGEASSDDLMQRVSSEAKAVASEVGGKLDVGFGGDIPTAMAEREALLEDIGHVSGAAILLVFGSIILFFRSLRALLYIGAAVVLGATFSFAIAALAIGRLNAATSFLGSIIVGNGINYGIVYLARYVEQRSNGIAVQPALLDAALTSLRATWLAALAASLAYASLSTTGFRGFSEFGMIGGVGMVLCWFCTYTILPACIGCFEASGKSGLGARRAERRFSLAGWVTNMAARHPRSILAAALLLGAAAAWPTFQFLKDPWEYDFSKLRSVSSARAGASHYSALADKVFGTRGAPVLILADTMNDAPRVAKSALAADRRFGEGKLIEKVETIFDRLGGEPEEVQAKLSLLTSIREHIDALRRHATAQDGAILDEFRPPEALRAPTVADLPAMLKQQFTESNGRVGTPVFVSLNRKISQSKGQNLLKISEMLAHITRSDGSSVPNASRATVFAEMIRSMERDGTRATLLALLTVIIVSVVLTRSALTAACVTGSLLLAVVLLTGWLAIGEQRLNFLNFVALPLTFGIGVEYAINIHERHRVEGDVARAGRSVGGAVALCSLTTIFGYGALMFADNRALQSFGRCAIAGEILCLATALIALPAVLSLLGKKRTQRPEQAGSTALLV
ncbi:MAG: efflux RND transporter permease subunit [Myxococcota bacterium]